ATMGSGPPVDSAPSDAARCLYRATVPLRAMPRLLRSSPMRTIKFPPLKRALAVCIGALAFAGASQAAGDKAAYESAKASAKSTYEAARAKCDVLKDNAQDICVAQAKAARTRTDEQAEAAYKDTPKAREHAI